VRQYIGSAQTETGDRLRHLPVSFFSSVMGLSGVSIALQKAAEASLAPDGLWLGALVLSSAVLGALLIAYIRKLLIYTTDVVSEFRHPVRINFFPAISISFILQAIAYFPLSHTVSFWLWVVGVILQLVLSVTIIGGWVWRDTHNIANLNPAWFIPAVGNILVPVVGVNHAPADISLFFFATGMFFWILLVTVFFYRSIFHEAIPEKLQPLLFILLSPPAIGVISLYKLTGGLGMTAMLLYFVGLFTLLVLLSRLKNFMTIPFMLPWWAYTFPVAAITIATIVVYRVSHQYIYGFIAQILLVATISITTITFIMTIRAMRRGKICSPEGQ